MSLTKVKSNIHHHLSFAACHLPLSHQVDGFQLLVDSGCSKQYIDLKLIRGVESRMMEYTEVSLSMEIKAVGDNILYGTAQGILLVSVRDSPYVCRKVELPIVFVLRLNMFSSSLVAAAQKYVKTVTTKGGSILDLGSFFIELQRLDMLDNLDLAVAKGSKQTESVCWAIWGKTFGNNTVLTASILRKPLVLLAVSINIDQRA